METAGTQGDALCLEGW